MNFEIRKLSELNNYLETAFSEKFGYEHDEISECLAVLDNFLKEVDVNLNIGIELSYIDKVHRDSYYQYYSGKLSHYRRDCIRLSFFENEISLEDFFAETSHQKLQDCFLGFLVIRPTHEQIIGRNIFRPDFKKRRPKVFSITTLYSVSVNGLNLKIEGFPHSSQDSELMVCAETTIWSVMEYFSQKYSDYKTVLPRDINKVISSISAERRIPSPGLTGLEISFALKEFGFGVKIYSANTYPNSDFFKIIQTYVESGIPVIAAIANKNLGHVVIITGRTIFDNPDGFQFPVMQKLQGGSYLYDYYHQPCKYLVIDDNLPPYSLIGLTNPSCNYGSGLWEDCKIEAAIIPLHHKIYMEADRAIELTSQLINEISMIISLPNYVTRVYLTSSKSYKNYIIKNNKLDNIVKTILIDCPMPKFVWIAELSTLGLHPDDACGLIVMDATEPKKSGFIACLLENTYFGKINGKSGNYSIPLQPFKRHNNLKMF